MLRLTGIIVLLCLIPWGSIYSGEDDCGCIHVLFIMDTSGSMFDDIDSLCLGIDQTVSCLQDKGFQIRYGILAIWAPYSCALNSFLNWRQGLIDSPEDWGEATYLGARYNGWIDGCRRLIIPMSDEPPENGEPCNRADDQAAQKAIFGALTNNVVVSPIIGLGGYAFECLRRIVPEIAYQTGGVSYFVDQSDTGVRYSQFLCDHIEQSIKPKLHYPDQRICEDECVTLQGSVQKGKPPFQYSWQPVDYLDDPAAATPTACPVENITYYVEVIDSFNCIGRDTIVVEINDIDAEITGATYNCESSCLVLSSEVTGGVTPYSFKWTPAEGFPVDTVLNPVLCPEDDHFVMLTVTDAEGCMVTKSHWVYKTNPLELSLGEDTTVCSNSDISIRRSFSLSGGLGPFSYSWEPTVLFDYPGRMDATALVTETTKIFLIITDERDCVIKDSFVVEVPDRPDVQISGQREICAGEDIILTKSYTGDCLDFNSWWVLFPGSVNDSLVATNMQSINLTGTISGNYRVIVVDTCFLGCSGRDTFSFKVSKLGDISLDVISIDQCNKEICLAIETPEDAGRVDVFLDWNSDSEFEDTTASPVSSFNYCKEDLPGNVDFNITVKIIDALGCESSGSIAAFIPIACCADWNNAEGRNYPACVDVSQENSTLCHGNIQFQHFSIPNADETDTIAGYLRDQVLKAYKWAENNPIVFPINRLLHNYPELHRITAYDASGESILSTENLNLLTINYSNSYSEDVPEAWLKIFVFNIEYNTWDLVADSEVDTINDIVSAPIDSFDKIYTIMGHKVPRKLCNHFSAYPVPLRHSRGGLTFKYLLTENADVTITVYTPWGNFIRKFSIKAGENGGHGHLDGYWNEIHWDGLSESNRKIANGGYIAYFESMAPESRRVCNMMIKFGVAR